MSCNLPATCTINIDWYFTKIIFKVSKTRSNELLWKALKINILKLPCSYLHELATQTCYVHFQLNCLEFTVYFIIKLNILEKS